MKPAVSVIIPTYNRSNYLAAAIQSVLNQKLPDGQVLEVIVVDDGSTDDTDKIIDRFGSQVRFFRLHHTGLPARARNFGIHKANADLIAFQDSDDLWVQGKLEQQLRVFDDPDIVLCYGNGQIMEASGKLTKKLVVPNSHLRSGNIFPHLVKENFISTLTVVARKDALQKLGGFNESLKLRGLEDYELWLRLIGLKLGRAQAIKKTLAYYRRHDQNVSLESTNHPLEDIIFALQSVSINCGAQLDEVDKSMLEKTIETFQNNLVEYKKTSAPLVSIIMSVYNAGSFLNEAIDSILKQTYDNFEFIIVDDGSTDASWKTIKSFKDERIRAFHQSNKGLQAGLNTGIKKASGKYIARMDQDDISLPQRIEKQVRFLEMNDRIGIIGTNFALINDKGKILDHSYYLERPEDLRLEILTRNPFGHGTVMFRRSILDEIGVYNLNEPVEDYELWWRILQRYNGSNLIEELYKWRVVSSSMSHSASEERQELIHRLIKKIWLQTPPPSVKYNQIKDGLAHYGQISPEYGGQFMFMLSALCLGAFRMRRYGYAISLLFKLLAANKLFRQTLRDMHHNQLSHEYLLVHIHPN